MNQNRRFEQFLLQNTPYILFVVVFLVFSLLAPRFFSIPAAETILKLSLIHISEPTRPY